MKGDNEDDRRRRQKVERKMSGDGRRRFPRAKTAAFVTNILPAPNYSTSTYRTAVIVSTQYATNHFDFL